MKKLSITERICSFLKKNILSQQPKMWSFIKPRWLRAIVRIMGLAAWCIFPFLCFLAMEYINFFDTSPELAKGENLEQLRKLFETKTSVIVLDLMILYTAAVILVMVFKHLWVSCAVLGTVSIIVPCVSFLKYQLTGEYFYPWDIQQTGNAGMLTEYVSIPLPRVVWLIAGAFLIMTLFVFFTKASLPIRWNIRIPVAVIIVLSIYVTYSVPAESNALVEKHGMTFVSTGHQDSNYSTNGFIGAFTLNLLSGNVVVPDGYSAELMDRITDECNEEAVKEDFSSPNVILLLQESFWDITRLPGCTFSSDPLENYREIVSRDGVYSGLFSTTGFGGGTVRPEFEVLTGLSVDYLPSGSVPYQYVKEPLETYVSLYKDLGYSAIAIHPYVSGFYMRDTKYPLIGFDSTLFFDELRSIEEVEYSWRGAQISDDSVVNYIEYFIEENTDPLFLFAITMEGHQPYTSKFTDEQLEISVQCDGFDAELANTVSQYTQCIVDADRALLRLTEYIDSCEEETILVMFGDHAPTLGSNMAGYKYGGLVENPSKLSMEEKKMIYTTPFLIYSNFDLEESSMLTEGTDNLIASYNLMNAATELVGGPKTVLMDFLRYFHEDTPGYNIRMGITRDEELVSFAKRHKAFTYDRLVGKKYSLK